MIVTNNISRLSLLGCDLPDSVKKEFDYIDDPDGDIFLKYKGEYYWIGDFIWNNPENSVFDTQWQGYINLSAFHGVLIKQCTQDTDRYILASYYC